MEPNLCAKFKIFGFGDVQTEEQQQEAEELGKLTFYYISLVSDAILPYFRYTYMLLIATILWQQN